VKAKGMMVTVYFDAEHLGVNAFFGKPLLMLVG